MRKTFKSHRESSQKWKEFDQDVDELVESMQPHELHTSSHLRALNREGYEMSIPHIISLAKGELSEAPYSAHIRAHEILAKHSIGNSDHVLLENSELMNTIYFATAQFLGDYEKFKGWMATIQAALKYPQ